MLAFRWGTGRSHRQLWGCWGVAQWGMGRRAVRRRVLALAAGGAMSIGLSSCSPTNANGLTRIDGTPAVVNCGGWIGSVEVRDAATQRLIWMARIGDDLADVRNPSTDHVMLGELPNPAWVQIGELNVAPAARVWSPVPMLKVANGSAKLKPGRASMPKREL